MVIFPETCPGVCVADRLSSFCEAILDVDDLCKSDLRCCVAKNVFGNDPPEELILPGQKTKSKPKPAKKTTKKPTRRPSSSSSSNKVSDKNSDCPGTCVSGFFALLCDEIDRSVKCADGGRCCISKRSKRPTKGGSRPTSSKSACPGVCIPQMMSNVCTVVPNISTCPKGTVCCETKDKDRNKTKTKTSPSKKKTPPKRKTPSRPSGGSSSQGPDLLQLVGPLLSAATGSSDSGSTMAALLPVLGPALGSMLAGGGGSGGSSGISRPGSAPQRPGNDNVGSLAATMLPVLGSLLGGGNSGGSPPKRKPPPYRKPLPKRPPFPGRTTTTTTPKPQDIRPECPGTCIASYLSFTCFGKSINIDPQGRPQTWPVPITLFSQVVR